MTKLILPLVAVLAAASTGHAQEFYLDRLPADQLDVLPPSARVHGAPGGMRVVDGSCQKRPHADLRRRIVEIAIQEWAYFGFLVLDQTGIVEDSRDRRRRRGPRLGATESARLADSIAGYWSITADGAWILERQNSVWRGPYGVASRWRDPWSAAFVSWVMCEGGLGEATQFRRAIAHHTYIDQAIEARGNTSSNAAYVAYDVGELIIEPGDLLCSSRRAAYRTIAERQDDLGVGVRSHCDIVVGVDVPRDRILVIGGNVRGAVRLKLLAAVFGEPREPQPAVRSVGLGRRTVFAHLKLQADPIEGDALERSPTLRTLRQQRGALAWLRQRLDGGFTRSVRAVTTSTTSVGSRDQPARRPL